MKFRDLLPILFFGLILLESCENKEYEEFEAPGIEILSATILSDNEFEVEIKLDLGIGASIKEAYIDLLNISQEATAPTQHRINLNQEKAQTHLLKIKVSETLNDYRIKAVLKSHKNEYSSSPQIIRFSHKITQTGITRMELYTGETESDSYYIDEATKVGKTLKKGKHFLINIHYSKIPPQTTKFEVKLNGEIPVKSEVTFNGWTENGTIHASCTLPTDIELGIYAIHTYVNGVEYVLEYNIRIIPGNNREVVLNNMPYDIMHLSDPTTHFVKGDKVHYIHSEYDPPKMIIYNMATKSWDEKNINVVESPYVSLFNRNKIINGTHEYLMCNVLEKNPFDSMYTTDSHWIISFDDDTNLWKKITAYPGKGNRSLIAFAVNNKIYIGGGVQEDYLNGIYTYTENQTDFWEYDINTDQWSEKNTLPYPTRYDGFINSSTATATKGYVFTSNRDLWQYSPESDSWEKLNPLRSGPIFRYHSKLVVHNNQLYLAGGYAYGNAGINLLDFWKYDLTIGEWILVDMFDIYFRSSSVETFVYQNKVILGYSSRPFYNSKALFEEIDIP